MKVIGVALALRAKLLRDMSGLCKKRWLMEEGFHQAEANRRQSCELIQWLENSWNLHSCNLQGLSDIAALLGKEFYELDQALGRSEHVAAEAGIEQSSSRGSRAPLLHQDVVCLHHRGHQVKISTIGLECVVGRHVARQHERLAGATLCEMPLLLEVFRFSKRLQAASSP